jgi:hypothetical protein
VGDVSAVFAVWLVGCRYTMESAVKLNGLHQQPGRAQGIEGGGGVVGGGTHSAPPRSAQKSQVP